MLIHWHRLPVLALLMVTLLGSAQASASEEALREYVERNTEQLVQKLNEERELYKNDPEAFYQSMDQALSDFVDFRRIAARVMGRYARQATPEQRDEFVRVFKRSLFDSYAQALVDSEDFTIRVTDATIDPNNGDRALVNMEVETASGNKYPVTYSMYRNDQDKWLMENVIVEGVNIGLAFRDRFAQDMEANRGNIDKVIAGWSDAVEAIDIDGDGNNQ
ncbi:MAG: ABC transporter substrate-binding protein [Marinobacter sp.]|uniref:MlaC/ttg2D family ABC transporter substrate-binding protein n=1 Tax=Marinobacter sp. TaxID=50741 RepID=UPI00299D3BC4|nr:ABC transporter substrate-binding protein [Marinobacter sp.]MDX1633852.1 ABC transporter substrate-binding protein [Marinobacter sp.]